MDKKDKIKKNVPSYFKPTVNVYWKNLLEAFGSEDDRSIAQITEAKKQIFVETASKTYLDALGDNVAVYRPLELNLSDENYRQLIELLSFYPKQVKSLILSILDVFYGEIFSRYNVQTVNNATYNLTGGESLTFRTESDDTVDVTRVLTADGETDGAGTIRLSTTAGMYVGQNVSVSDDNSPEILATITGLTNNIATLDISTSFLTVSDNAFAIFSTYQYVTFKSTDFETPGAATAQEVAVVINNTAVGAFSTSISSDTQVNLRTEVTGNKGLIQVLGGTANNILAFPTTPARSLRVQVSEINPNEIIIQIPSTIPALRRTLPGSAHLHPDSTVGTPWIGSFLYDTDGDYTVKKEVTTLNQTISSGSVYTQISVIDASNIPNEAGYLMLDFGKEEMEYPVPYIGRPNNSTLLLNPGYVFQTSHSAGELINTMLTSPTIPRAGGGDYPVYMVGISTAREQVQEIVRSIIATGVVIRWQVNYPVCGKF